MSCIRNYYSRSVDVSTRCVARSMRATCTPIAVGLEYDFLIKLTKLV